MKKRSPPTKAISLKPDFAEAFFNLGAALEPSAARG